MSLVLRAMDFDAERFAPLLSEAGGDGAFLFRLESDWLSGALRFDRPGELLLGALEGEALVGVGGISLHPYQPEPGLGRLRHLYVLKARRGRGIGSVLLEALIAHGRTHFDVLRLRTDNPTAAAIYEGYGFVATACPGETHRLSLRTSLSKRRCGSPTALGRSATELVQTLA